MPSMLNESAWNVRTKSCHTLALEMLPKRIDFGKHHLKCSHRLLAQKENILPLRRKRQHYRRVNTFIEVCSGT
jgi:hypothetical protein